MIILSALLALFLVVSAGTPPAFARSSYRHDRDQRSSDIEEELEEEEQNLREEKLQAEAAEHEEQESRLNDLGIDSELDEGDFDPALDFDPSLDDKPEKND